MPTPTLSSTTAERVVHAARELHRRLGGGWSPTVYRDGLALLLGEAGIATCAGAEIGAAPCLARDLVTASSLVVRVVGVGRPRHPLADCLARTGLEVGLLLRFCDDAVEATVVHPTEGADDRPAAGEAIHRRGERSTPMERRGSSAVV